MQRKQVISTETRMYNDNVHLIQDKNSLPTEAYQAMLHDIEANTFDGDDRAIARNYIVQLSLENANITECDMFIQEAIGRLELQPSI